MGPVCALHVQWAITVRAMTYRSLSDANAWSRRALARIANPLSVDNREANCTSKSAACVAEWLASPGFDSPVQAL